VSEPKVAPEKLRENALALKIGRKLLEWSGISMGSPDALARFADALDRSTIPEAAAEVGCAVIDDIDEDDDDNGPSCVCGDPTHGDYVECGVCGAVLCDACDYREDNQEEPRCPAHRPPPTRDPDRE